MPHSCDDHLEIRLREYADGSKHYVYQCLFCGEQKGGCLNKEDAFQELREEPKKFDEEIFDAYQEQQKEKMRALGVSFSVKPRVDAKRNSLIKALNSNIASIIDYLGDIQGVDLIQRELNRYKKQSFEKKISELDRFKSEGELKEWLVHHLAKDFYFDEEVQGVHLAEGKCVKIDCVLQAKPHVVVEGFTAEPFGVEVKYIPQDNGFTRRASRAFWQTISYNDCEFSYEGKKIKPKFCLLFSNLCFDNERSVLKNFEGSMANDFAELGAMENLANHAKVGTLKIFGTQKKFRGWAIKFSSSSYFSCYLKSNTWLYKLGRENLIEKVRIGNF